MIPIAVSIRNVRNVLRMRLLCSTREMSDKIHHARQGFEGAMNRTPAGPYLVLGPLQNIIWNRVRQARKG